MAKMFPGDISVYNATGSELRLFDELKRQLDDRITVFYSVEWYSNENNRRENSEADFIIYDPDFGYLTIEVKGGKRITKRNGVWEIIDSYGLRRLNKSPFEQAKNSMYFFKNYYFESYREHFPGTYGFACAFPNYNIEEDLGSEARKEIIIDFKDMDNLGKRINEIFHYWKNKNNTNQFLVQEVHQKFIKMINKRVSFSEIAARKIEDNRRKLNIINRVQENYLDFLENYNQAFITGGAGTGKTWIAVKKALREAQKEKKVLFICFNKYLKQFVQDKLKEIDNIRIETIESLLYNQLGQRRYDELKENNFKGLFDTYYNLDSKETFDAIIVDEAQDFNLEWALTIRSMLVNENESVLYVFLDKEQNIFSRDFGDGFMINTPPFILTENLRNTASIIEWAKKKTDLGIVTKTNNINGIEPYYSKFRRARDLRKELDNIIRQLIDKELIPSSSITILSNRTLKNSILKNWNALGGFNIKEGTEFERSNSNELIYYTVQSFKGLESDVIIYIKHNSNRFNSKMLEYVAYTRARYILYVLEINEE